MPQKPNRRIYKLPEIDPPSPYSGARLWRVPGGIPAVMHLAQLSQDENTQAVAGIWCALSPPSRQRADIAELVRGAFIAGANVSVASFLANVYQTGQELKALALKLPEFRILIPGFTERERSEPGVSLEIDEREASVKEALEHALMRGESLRLLAAPKKYRRRRLDGRLVRWRADASKYATHLRRKLGIPQPRFAALCMTSVNTIQSWEAQIETPTMRHQWFLRLFQSYTKEHGIRAFRQRFVEQAVLVTSSDQRRSSASISIAFPSS